MALEAVCAVISMMLSNCSAIGITGSEVVSQDATSRAQHHFFSMAADSPGVMATIVSSSASSWHSACVLRVYSDKLALLQRNISFMWPSLVVQKLLALGCGCELPRGGLL